VAGELLPQWPARRFRAEELAVNFVHRSEFFHVCEKDRGLHYLIQATTRSFEHARQILYHLLRLLGYAPGDKLSRLRIDWYLTRSEYKSIDSDCLGIGTDALGAWSVWMISFTVANASI